MTTDRLSTLFESVTTQLTLVFVTTKHGKIEQELSTTGANLAGVLDKNSGKIGGIVEQNCKAGAVEHFRKVRGVVNSFPPDAYSIAPIRGLWVI